MGVKDAVEMELRALGPLGELRKLASWIELMSEWVLQGAHAWGYKVVRWLDIADVQGLLEWWAKHRPLQVMERVVHARVLGVALIHLLLLLQWSIIVNDVVSIVIIQVNDVDLVDVIALRTISCFWRHLCVWRWLFWSLGLTWRSLANWVWSWWLETSELVFRIMYLCRHCIRESRLLLLVTDVHASYLVLPSPLFSILFHCLCYALLLWFRRCFLLSLNLFINSAIK